MTKKGLNIVSEKIGICLRDSEGTVLFQNPICTAHCGQQSGHKCEKGCQLRETSSQPGAHIENNLKTLRNIQTDISMVDAVVMKDEQSAITILYDKSHSQAAQLKQLQKYQLSAAELEIIKRYLSGFSSREIAKSLFISHSTLRTHLNNIYKKIPQELKEEIIACHLHREN